MKVSVLGSLCLIFLFLTGCSNAAKMRQEQREKVAATSGLFCEFVSGDDYHDVDVELNLTMAKRCDSAKEFSITSYKSSSEVNGLVYCCTMKRVASAMPAPAPSAAVAPAVSKPVPAKAAPAAPAVVPAATETELE